MSKFRVYNIYLARYDGMVLVLWPKRIELHEVIYKIKPKLVRYLLKNLNV